MKKTICLLLLVSLCLLLLSSCLTMALMSSNHYSSLTYMTKKQGFEFDKSKRTVVLYVDSDLQWQRAGEEALYDALTREGFSDVLMFSDYGRYKDYSSEGGKNTYDVLESLNADYYVFAGVSDYYTYTGGGDVARLTIETYWIPLFGEYAYDYVVQSTTTTEAGTNNMIGFSKSLEDAFESYAKSFADKL